MQIEKLIHDPDFQKKLLAAEDENTIRSLFTEEYAGAAENETQKSVQSALKAMLPEGEELDENALELVAGGCSVWNWLRSRLTMGTGAYGGSRMGRR